MVAEAAGVVCRRLEGAAQGVHFSHRRDLARVAEVIFINTSCKGRTGCRFHSDDARISFAGQFVLHERRDEASQVGTAAGTSDDEVRVLVQLFHGDLGFQADDRLVKEHLVEHRAQHVAVSFVGHGYFYSFRNSASKASAVVRIFCQDLSACLRPVGWRCKDLCAKRLHDVLTERLLVIGNFDHVHLQVETKIGTCFGKCCSPLTCTGFCSHALKAFLFSVVSLCYCGVELMTAGGVVSFEFIVDLRWRVQGFFQIVSSAKRCRAIDLIDIADFFRNVEVSRFVVHFLLGQFLAEYRVKVFHYRRFPGCRIDHRRCLLFHISAQVIPLLRDLVFG